MKKLNFLLLLSFILVISVFINEAKAFFNKNELVQITEIAKQHNIGIDKWSMYIKEPITEHTSLSDINKRIKEIRKGETGYTWGKTEFKGNHYKISGERNSSSLDIAEKILIIYYPQKDKFQLSITYDIKGSSWDGSKWSKIANLYQSKIDNGSVFYTVDGTTNIKGPLNVEAMKLLKKFSGETIQSLNEENFISLSAYTDRWDSKLPLGNNQFMNLHIAYRNANNSNDIVKVTIGTPIITSEY
jgi:hypothetical protein